MSMLPVLMFPLNGAILRSNLFSAAAPLPRATSRTVPASWSRTVVMNLRLGLSCLNTYSSSTPMFLTLL